MLNNPVVNYTDTDNDKMMVQGCWYWKPLLMEANYFLKVNLKVAFLQYCDEVVFWICFSSILLMELLDLSRCFYFPHQYFFFSFCFFPMFNVCSNIGISRVERKMKFTIINHFSCSQFLLVKSFLIIKRNDITSRYFYIRILIGCSATAAKL